MKLVTADQMRELDRRTIQEWGTPGEVLMERAGKGVADVVRRTIEVSGFVTPTIQLIAGRGNNGGDAFVAARHLKEMSFHPEIWLSSTANQVKGDALLHLSRMKSAGVPMRELPTKDDWDEAIIDSSTIDILIDGVLGTGSNGPARGPAVGAIQYINALSEDAFVISIDIPSGLDADTGVKDGDAVKADITVTMGLPKEGVAHPSSLDYVGSVDVIDIGIPEEYIEDVELKCKNEMIHINDLKPLFGRRARESHKGDYGHVLLMGGARGYAGAIAMSARTAIRSGIGLVTVVAPSSIASVVAGTNLECMVAYAPETQMGSISVKSWPLWRERLKDFSTLLVGPGLTRNKESFELVTQILSECSIPLVLDADAISVLSGHSEALLKAKVPVVLTPHPGELATLESCSVVDIQSKRMEMAQDTASKYHCTVVLKGAGTIVAECGKAIQINMSGNPGMATGGSGDVLAGLLAGFLGQGMSTYDAARSAVYLHARAGDMAAWRKSQQGMIAGDIIDEIPYVFRELAVR